MRRMGRDYLSIMGISLLIETIENVRKRLNPHLGIVGVLPTMFSARNTHDNEALAELGSSALNRGEVRL